MSSFLNSLHIINVWLWFNTFISKNRYILHQNHFWHVMSEDQYFKSYLMHLNKLLQKLTILNEILQVLDIRLVANDADWRYCLATVSTSSSMWFFPIYIYISKWKALFLILLLCNAIVNPYFHKLFFQIIQIKVWQCFFFLFRSRMLYML